MRRQSTIYQPPPAWLSIALQKILWICALLLTITTGSMYGQVTQGSITKAITSNNPTLSSGTIPSGEVFTYTITFSISGTAPATGVMVTDVVPAALTVVNVIAGSYPVTISPPSPTGTTVSINCGTVNAGAGGQVQINVKFKEGETCDGTIACNNAILKAQNFVDSVKSNQVCITATASTGSKFKLSKRFLANLPNSIIRWVVEIDQPSGGDIGSYNLKNLKLQDDIPFGATLLNVQVDPVSYNPLTPVTNLNYGNGTWDDIDLPVSPYQYKRIYWVDVQYPASTFADSAIVTNCAYLSAEMECVDDTTIKLKACSDEVRVRHNVQLTRACALSKNISLSANNNGPFSPGCAGSYEVKSSNTGTAPLNNVVMDDDLPHEIDVTEIKTSLHILCLKVEYWTTALGQTTGPITINTPPASLTVNHSGTPTITTIVLPTNAYITKIRWTYSTINVAQSVNNSIVFTILPAKHSNALDLTTAGDIIFNIATTTATGINPLLVVNKTEVSSYGPRITLSKSVHNCVAPSAPFFPGDIVRFRLVIGNYGNAPAGPFAITDVLPTYFSYVGNERYYYISGPWGKFNNIAVCTANSIYATTMVTPGSQNIPGATSLLWNVPGGLNFGCDGSLSYIVIEFDAKISQSPAAPAQSYKNKFTVQSQQLGTLPSPDAQIVVNAITGIKTEKQVRGLPNGTFGTTAQVAPNGLVEYKLRVTNSGNQAIDNLRLVDILPAAGDKYVVNFTQSRGSTFGMVMNATPVVVTGTPAYSGAVPLAGYGTSANQCRNPYLQLGTDVASCTPWPTPAPITPAPPPSGTTALGLALDPSWVLQPSGVLEITFKAKAPAAFVPGQACNSFAVTGRTVTNGQYFPAMEPSPVCVTLKEKPDCFDRIEKSITCRLDKDGNVVYDYCYRIQNNTTGNGILFNPNVIAPIGTIIQPPYFDLNSNQIPPNGISKPLCMTISGPNLQAGAWVKFEDSFCAYFPGRGCVKCEVLDSVQIPKCPLPVDCCPKDFTHSFKNLKLTVNVNGTTTLSGVLLAGGQAMQSVTVSIVNCYIIGNPVSIQVPVYGQFSAGTLNGLPGTITPMHEIKFGTWAPCKDFTGGIPLNLTMKFPPGGTYGWAGNWWWKSDLLKFCLRVRYVDCECRSCDTLICFQGNRYGSIIYTKDVGNVGVIKRFGLGGTANLKDDGASTQAAAPTAPFVGTLMGQDSGRLEVMFPEPDTGTVKFVGMKIQVADSTVKLVNISGNNGFTMADGMAFGYFNAAPNDKLSLGLKYAGLGDRKTLDHIVTISYQISGIEGIDEGETFEEEIPVTFRRDGVMGGDIVTEEAPAGISDVRVFALHLLNANKSGEAIDQVVLQTEPGVRIIGVGPTRNDSVAIVQFGKTEAGRAVTGEDVGGIRTTIAVKESHKPIYLTVAGFKGPTTLRFTTLNANGETISEGSIVLMSPLTGAFNDDNPDRATTGAAGGIVGRSYPNPNKGTATIEFMLPHSEQKVTLIVTDESGKEVARLVDGEQWEAGLHTIWFDGTHLPSGTYYYQLQAGGRTETGFIKLIK